MPDRTIWNRYWQFDRIASCFDGAGAHNYDEEIISGWRAFFARLADGSRVLDLCTGNGAIALMAAETDLAEHKGFEIVAVDQADIDPPGFVSRHRPELERIDFRGATNVEALPFADASFEAVVSHYGLEYSDLTLSVPELCRVVAPGGSGRLVLHAAEGAVRADSERFIEDADFLLETIDLPGAARRCFESLAAAERDPRASAQAHALAQQSVTAFEAALMQGAQRLPAAADKAMLRNCGAVLIDTFNRRARLDLDQLLAKAEEVRAEIEAHRGRLQALIDAAVTREGAASIAARLGEGGAETIEIGELRHDGQLVGHVIEARFAA